MVRVQSMEEDSWQASFSQSQQQQAIRILEDGGLIFLPHLGFRVLDSESRFLVSESVHPGAKNVSLDVRGRVLRGSTAQGMDEAALRDMLNRFARQSFGLVRSLPPHYAQTAQQARTSYRPVEASSRTSSWRKDDRRLHVDSFPSSPNQGRRLLRVFSNINPEGKNRVWKLGEGFEDVADRFLPLAGRPLPGFARLLLALGITKSLRSEYDHIMLRIHDRMKADQHYQAITPSIQLQLPAGSTWIVFTDSVSHAALSGRFMMEQTFLLPVEGMLDPGRAPLRVLERLVGRTLS